MAEDAIKVADTMLELLPPSQGGGFSARGGSSDPALDTALDGEHLPALQRAGEAGELLLEGMRDGLNVGRLICRRFLDEAEALPAGMPLDVKQARLASDTAGWMCRLGAKVAESAFRARQDDVVGRLLAQLNQQSTQPK